MIAVFEQLVEAIVLEFGHLKLSIRRVFYRSFCRLALHRSTLGWAS
jgi:hypothetical protein